MDELEKNWLKYVEIFPEESGSLATLVVSNGPEMAVKILNIAVDRGKKIHFSTDDETTATGTFIQGEEINFE